MKRFALALLCLLVILSLCACGTVGNNTAEQNNNAPAQNAQNIKTLARFAGEWHLTESEYEDAAPCETAPVIRMWEDGTFLAYEEDGTEVARGYFEEMPEDIEGTVITWINLYTEDDQLYLGFIDEGEEHPTEFYVGNGGVDHYVLVEE